VRRNSDLDLVCGVNGQGSCVFGAYGGFLLFFYFFWEL